MRYVNESETAAISIRNESQPLFDIILVDRRVDSDRADGKWYK